MSWVLKLPANIITSLVSLATRDPESDARIRLDRLRGLPTSVDNMTPGHPTLTTLEARPITPDVSTHSIIAVRGDGPPEKGGDGVVRYSSAHLEGVESELIVRSGHSTHSKPRSIEEVRRILVLWPAAPVTAAVLAFGLLAAFA